jgi:hypothetical protein
VKARDPGKGYIMKEHKVVGLNVKLNLSHMELPL